MATTSALRSRRITRSAVIEEIAVVGRKVKQEASILQDAIYELNPNQRRELYGTASVSALADDNGCQFDLAKVKIEPIETTSESNVEKITVDLNIVKNEPENGISQPYVLLDDCLNRKVKQELQPLDVLGPITTLDLNTVKKEHENITKYPYVLLTDCLLNSKIKLEPKFSKEIPDSITGAVLKAVKSESKDTSLLLKATVNSDIKLEPIRRSKRNHVKVVYEEQENDSTKKKLLRSSTTPSIKLELFNGKNALWEPPNWVEVMDNIRKMRKERNAPIDVMGCYQWMDQGENLKVSRYQTFVSLLLSSKTRDEINHTAMTRLRKHGLTIGQILKTDEETIGKLIAPVTFWRTKARQVLRATTLLREKFKDDIPNTFQGLVSLPGVGPKMAHICMSVAWGQITGIGVGSFVHRVANRLGWAHTWEPERTRLALESWLPRSYWPEINELLVGFGQQTCTARDPNCDECLNAAKVMCPSAPLTLYYEME